MDLSAAWMVLPPPRGADRMLFLPLSAAREAVCLYDRAIDEIQAHPRSRRRLMKDLPPGSAAAIAAHCKPEANVTTLIDLHQRAWDVCNKQWAVAPGALVDTSDVDALSLAGRGLERPRRQSSPNHRQRVAKWLGDEGLDYVVAITSMLND